MIKLIIVLLAGAVITTAVDQAIGFHIANMTLGILHKVMYMGWGVLIRDAARKL